MIKELNVVSCGHCGKVFGHEMGVDELHCPYCDMQDDISSFPDFFATEIDSSIISLQPLVDKFHGLKPAILYVVTYYNGEKDDWDVAVARTPEEAKASVIEDYIENNDIELMDVEYQKIEAYPIDSGNGYKVTCIKNAEKSN